MIDLLSEIKIIIAIIFIATVISSGLCIVIVERNNAYNQGYIDGLIRNYSGDLQITSDGLIPDIKIKKPKTKGC